MDPLYLSRRVRRELPDLTSPLTKNASRQLLSEIHRKLDLRVPRRPRTFTRLVRKRTTSKVRYHAPLYGCAFSRIKSTPHHHSPALRRHARAKSLGLILSPPRTHQQPPHAKVTIISDAPSQSHFIRRAFGFAVAWYFLTSGPAVAVLCRAERPRNRPRTILDPADRRDPQRQSELGTTLV